MGVFDILKNIFQNKFQTYNNEDPSRLPANIENELRKEILSNHENEGINIITLPAEGLDSHGSNQLMEEIEGFFENFFSFGIKPDQFFKSFPSYDNHDNYDEDDSEAKSLREKMLNDRPQIAAPFDEESDFKFFPGKLPSIFPIENDFFQKIDGEKNVEQDCDKDFDQDIRSGKRSLDDVLSKNMPRYPSNEFSLPNHEIFNFSRTTRKINSDGSIETQTTKKLSDGSEQTVVSRSIGDQTHSVINRKLPSGEEIRTENFINMNEDELKAFDEKWNKKKESNLLANDTGWSSFFSNSWTKPKL